MCCVKFFKTLETNRGSKPTLFIKMFVNNQNNLIAFIERGVSQPFIYFEFSQTMVDKRAFLYSR